MFNPCSTAPIETRSAVDFLLDDETLTSTDGLVALAGELLAPMCTSSEFIATRDSFKGLCALGSGVVEKVAAALQSDAPQELAEPARQGIASFLSLLEDREQDDISEVYAATLLLRIALAQFEAHMIERQQAPRQLLPEDESGVRSAQRRCLSTEAIADIDAHIARTTGVVELFVERGGDAGADIVNILDFTKRGFERAKAVEAFDDAWHRIIEAESLLKGAMVLAENSQGTCPGAVALLRDLIDETDALSGKFDGGEHYVANKQVAPPTRAAKAEREAVAA